MRIQPKVLVRAISFAIVLVCAPLAFSPTQGVVENAACAQGGEAGTCCTEHRSICNAGAQDHMGYYYKADGPCR